MSTLRISEKNWRSFFLDYRMAALGLDPIEIAAIVPQTSINCSAFAQAAKERAVAYATLRAMPATRHGRIIAQTPSIY